MASTMRAWQYSTIDSKLEECLKLEDLPAPNHASLGKDELVVEVVSASLNPADYKVPEAPVVGRLLVSLPATPAMDFSGRVVAKHPSNTAFETGQLVFGGYPGISQKGTLRQYIVIASSNCAPLPEGIDPDHAAAVGTAATTAYQSLLPDTLKAGGRVLINGGSGGTGTWAIQFAKALGVEVVATCSTKNVEFCRQLGADEVIDYKKEDIISNLKARGKVFDLVIDNVASSTDLYDISHTILKPGGTFAMVGVGESLTLSGIFSNLKKNLLPTFLGGKPYHFVVMKNETEYFRRIADWMVEGKAKAVIDSTYSFEDVPAAYSKLREGHARGKIVIHVANGTKDS
ncbi:hypothetical protein EsH8_IV_001215 [Colletotrichum jinshuiense]